MADHDLYLGTEIDGTEPVTLDMDHLTTHAVCVGMTGSGKTGLGIVALEELARRGRVAAGHRPQGRHGRSAAQLPVALGRRFRAVATAGRASRTESGRRSLRNRRIFGAKDSRAQVSAPTTFARCATVCAGSC